MSIAQRLGRPEILALTPFDLALPPPPGTVKLDCNESPFAPLVSGQPTINRYPDPQPATLRQRMADL